MKKNKEVENEFENIDEIVKKETKKKDKWWVKFIKELIPYVVILIVVVLIRTYLFTPIMVSGPSMKPTLEGGEIMILNKIYEIERFDVVVVDIKTEEIIKRVIAMPGETISCENGKIYVNGKLDLSVECDEIITNDDTVTIGRQSLMFSPYSDLEYKGYIDELKIFDKALNEKEIFLQHVNIIEKKFHPYKHRNLYFCSWCSYTCNNAC